MGSSIEIDQLKYLLEHVWQHLDKLLAGLDANGWQHRHGPDWVFADVPYHLAYFDHHVARYIEQGPNLPKSEQLMLTSLADMSAWNEAKFSRRPAGHNPEESLAAMEVERGRIRKALEGLADADLERPTWMMLLSLRGWRSLATVLQTLILHTWNEFIQLRIHMGLEVPEPDRALTRFCTHGFLVYSQAFLDLQAAAEARLSVVYDFPALGAWTLTVANSAWEIDEGASQDPDIRFSHSYITYMKIFNRILDFGEALRSGEVGVRGTDRLPDYATLYPPLKPDQIIPAAP